MRFLADDLLEGRGTGSRGYELAANYVATRFESMGLAPAGDDDSYFQPVLLTRASLVERQTSLVLVSSQQRRTLSFARDFVTFASVAHDQVRVMSDVVFLGYGITAPERSYDDYGELNVRGKIVAVLPGTPPSFSADVRAYYGALAVKQENALLHGAVGILHLNPTDDPLWELWIRFIRSGSVDWRRDARGPDGVAMLSAAASAALFNGTRMSLPDIVEAAKTDHIPHFAMPVRATLDIRSHRLAQHSPNVVAFLRGARLPNECVLYVAHLDHLGVGDPVDGDRIYNGAVDNASGVAAVLAIARAFAALPQRPDRSIAFLATTGEEPGERGSEYFVNHLPAHITQVVAAINIDGATLMLYPLHDVAAMGASNSTLVTAVERAAERLGLVVKREPLYPGGSDHFPFVQHGIPALWLVAGEETGDPKLDGHKLTDDWMRTRYHSPKDDMNQPLDFGAAASFAELNFLIGDDVARDQNPPRWNTGDFFGEKFGRDRPK